MKDHCIPFTPLSCVLHVTSTRVSMQWQFRWCCVSVLFFFFVSLDSIQTLYSHSVGSPLTPFSLVFGQLVRKLQQLSFSFRLVFGLHLIG